MKLYTTPFLFGIAALLLHFNLLARDSFEGKPYLTKQFTLQQDGMLHVETSGGNIAVTGDDTDEVVVEMYVKKNGSWSDWFSDEDAQEVLEDYQIQIEQQGQEILAIAKKKKNGWGSSKLSISFKVKVPRHISTQLSTSGGSVTLENVVGQQEATTSGGSLTFYRVSGDMQARTSGGSINVDDFDGNLNAKTSGGAIRMSNSTGELLVHTSGGSIVMDGVTGNIDASTSGGSIRADIKNLGDYLTLHTSGGSINAVVPQGLGLDIELSGSRVNTLLSNFTGEAKKDYIKGTLNGGGAQVKMSTSGGSVNLDYRMHASN